MAILGRFWGLKQGLIYCEIQQRPLSHPEFMRLSGSTCSVRWRKAGWAFESDWHQNEVWAVSMTQYLAQKLWLVHTALSSQVTSGEERAQELGCEKTWDLREEDGYQLCVAEEKQRSSAVSEENKPFKVWECPQLARTDEVNLTLPQNLCTSTGQQQNHH